MKGKVHITVRNRRVKYEITVKRNITIIRGNSATGKTTLIEMIRDYNLLGDESGVELLSDRDCTVLEGNLWKEQLAGKKQSVVFVDEGNRFVSSKEFAKEIKQTDNYYVLVTREGLETLPYSVEEIYEIRSSQKYGGLRQVYHEMVPIYSGLKDLARGTYTRVVTEDSNAGFQFFSAICSENGIACTSASGKSNIHKSILQYTQDTVLVIADGAAFGSEMDKVMGVVMFSDNIALYLPESFEWMVLMSDAFFDKDIMAMSANWEEYIDSREFFSWEQYFTFLLSQKTRGTYLQYSKKNINAAYLKGSIKNALMKQVKFMLPPIGTQTDMRVF